jgi:hypothetical protein
MTELMVRDPIELTEAELDLVTGGSTAVAGFGLANVALSTGNIDILRNADIDVLSGNNVSLRDIANQNHVGVGALLNILGGPSAILQQV